MHDFPLGWIALAGVFAVIVLTFIGWAPAPAGFAVAAAAAAGWCRWAETHHHG